MRGRNGKRFDLVPRKRLWLIRANQLLVYRVGSRLMGGRYPRRETEAALVLFPSDGGYLILLKTDGSHRLTEDKTRTMLTRMGLSKNQVDHDIQRAREHADLENGG